MQDIIRQPVQLIDEDLDAVAGGRGGVFVFVNDVNLADVDQYIRQVQIGGILNDQSAANVSSVTQVS